MHPLHRLNHFMPFLVMFYLMTSLLQLHSSLNLPFGPAGNERSLIANLKSEFDDFTKHSDKAFAYYDQTQYALVGYPSP